MCKECQESLKKVSDAHVEMVRIYEHISCLYDSFKIASDSPYECSESFLIGGPQGAYRLQSPYISPNVQYKVDAISNVGNSASIFIAPRPNTPVPGLATTDTPLGEFGGIGLLYVLNNGQTLAINSEWYDLIDSAAVLYVSIATTGAAYANIQFRHKR